MSSRAISLLAWSLAGLSVALFVASVPLWTLARSAQVAGGRGADLSLVGLFAQALFLAFPLVGALITSRRPGNPIGWICLTSGLLLMLLNTTEVYGVYGVTRPGSVPFAVAIAGINNWLWVPAVGLLATYLLLLFPDGRLPSARWRPLAWLSGAVLVTASIAIALKPGPLPGLGGVLNPFGLEGASWVLAAASASPPLLALCMAASALSLVLRFRRAGEEEREQIKWIAFSALVIVIVTLVPLVATPLSPAEGWFAPNTPAWLTLLQYTAQVSLAAIPISVGFAIQKYHLYDIDIIINRALVYGSLTLMLLLVYFGGVTTTQALFRTLTGQHQQPQLAVVVSTLAIAALFNPLRRRVQGFIDRRFYRQKYDAGKTLEAFSARLREETDLDSLNAELMKVVRDSMQPSRASLWLRPTPRDEQANQP